jgi:hypothetical protein
METNYKGVTIKTTFEQSADGKWKATAEFILPPADRDIYLAEQGAYQTKDEADNAILDLVQAIIDRSN